MWCERLLPLQYRRKRYLRNALPGPLHDYLATPFPHGKTRLSDVTFLALDFETTGLDLKHDHILSIGMVDIDRQGIDLGSAKHIVVRTQRELPPRSVTVHGLTDDMVSSGMPIRQAMGLLLKSLAGKVLLAHHARVEQELMQRVCAELFAGKWLAPTVDTARLGRRRLARRDKFLRPEQIKLDNLRSEYKLPAYHAHNALSDAIATGELLLAELAATGIPASELRLRDVLA